MKRTLLFFLTAFCSVMSFVACQKQEDSKTVFVSGVTLDQKTVTLSINESVTLIATVSPENASHKTVTWESSNTEVATVSGNGVVTALAAGNAVITVTTDESKKSATCNVTVNAAVVPPTPVSGVTLNQSTLTMTEGDKATLTPTVAPTNATNKAVTWSSDKPSVATVSATGEVTAKLAGSATITVTTTDGGKTATCAVTVKAQAGKGPNLLQDAGFEDPNDQSDNLPECWQIVPEEWFTAYYGALDPNYASVYTYSAGGASRASIYSVQASNGVVFFEGNGKAIKDVLTESYVGRLSMSGTSGMYQLVTVTPGDYWINVNMAFNVTSVNNVIKDETIKVLSSDGLILYGEVHIPMQDKTIMKVTGTVTIPAGVTQVRFQFDQRDYASPTANPPGIGRAPLLLFDQCEFRLLLPA